jgi:cell division protein FtsI/penicillin-binding protein 2
MALLALGWTVVLPARGGVGDLGQDYRWRDLSRSREVQAYIDAGLFQTMGSSSRRVELNREVYERYRAGEGDDPGLLQLIDMAADLTVVDGDIIPRDYLVMNPNPFADRGGARGTVLSADGVPLALTDDRGRRHYFLGEAAFHPVGYGGGAAQSQGFEAAASTLLRGRNLAASLREQAFLLDIHHGPEVELTLLAEVQRRAHGALEGSEGAAAVVLDLSNGDLLALASAPSVDPTGAGVGDWRGWLRDAAEPLRNRAIESPAGYSPPGSVFKLAVAAALLEGPGEGQRVLCRGYDDDLRVSCAHGKVHGRIGLEKALEASCNIYFAHKAVELGQETLRSMATRLGMNGEGVLLTPGLPGVEMRSGVSTVLGIGETLRDRDLARVGYGQGPVSVTVFDIARMGAAIAAGGTVHEPRLARAYGFSTETENGERDRSTLRELPVHEERQVLPRSTASKLRAYAHQVFAGRQGTARNLEHLWRGPEGYELGAESPGEGYVQIPVAGKTGSAWRSRYDTMDDAWMLAWAPAEDPRVLVSVMLQDAGEGGKVAGPVAMDLLRTALQALEEREARE